MSFGVVTMSNEYLATKGKRNITRLSQKLNIYDLIEIKTCKEVEVWQQLVVHLLIESSHFTQLVLDCCGVATTTLSSHCTKNVVFH